MSSHLDECMTFTWSSDPLVLINYDRSASLNGSMLTTTFIGSPMNAWLRRLLVYKKKKNSKKQARRCRQIAKNFSTCCILSHGLADGWSMDSLWHYDRCLVVIDIILIYGYISSLNPSNHWAGTEKRSSSDLSILWLNPHSTFLNSWRFVVASVPHAAFKFDKAYWFPFWDFRLTHCLH